MRGRGISWTFGIVWFVHISPKPVTYGVTDHYTDNKLLIPDWLVNALRSVRLRGDRFNITARQLKTALNL